MGCQQGQQVVLSWMGPSALQLQYQKGCAHSPRDLRPSRLGFKIAHALFSLLKALAPFSP